MFTIKEHKVSDDWVGSMLMDFTFSEFNEFTTRSSIKKAIKRGEFLVDGNQEGSGYRLKNNQTVTLIDLENKPPKPLDFPLEIVYEDEHIAIINKPAGIEVSGNKYFTIQNALISNIKISTEPDALKWSKPVHRLDYPTTGLLLIAKTITALHNLNEQFEQRKVQKRYRAIVSGKLPKTGNINNNIVSQVAETRYESVNYIRSLKTDWITEVDLFPHTGRKHQLRIHMANLGFPIVGEKDYGDGPVLRGKGLFLSAVEIEFCHPATGKNLKLKINEPVKFEKFLDHEQQNWESKYNDI